MNCETIFSLIVFGGVGLGVAAGVTTEVLLARAAYEPKNYLARWRERFAARRKEVAAELS